MTTLADLRKNPATRKLRAVREGRFVVLDENLLSPRPSHRRRARPGRPPPAPGCVSLSSTPSPSTATGRSSGSSTRCRASSGRWRSAGSTATPGARPLGVRGRGRLLPAGGGARARPGVAGRGSAATAHASSSTRPGSTSSAESFVDDFMASIRFEAIPGAIETLERAPWTWARPGSRLQLGRRARRAPRATRRRPLVLGGRDQRGSRRGQAGPGRVPSGARTAAGSRPHAHCTSATRTRTSRERWRPAMRFAPAPLATAFEGWS